MDSEVAMDIQSDDTSFKIVPWTYDFYGQHRDIKLDIDDIDALQERDGASEADMKIATSWKRRLLRNVFAFADALPFTVPALATEELEIHLHDLKRYARNADGVADEVRSKLAQVLSTAVADDRPVLLIAHSMGSVIAFDTLWEQRMNPDLSIDLLLTMGSPLGQKLIQRRLLGSKAKGIDRYPTSIKNWINLAAVGELTAIDTKLRNDYSDMIDNGFVADIDDREVRNYYHMHGALNVHAEYGYLINEVTASVVSRWWRRQTEPNQDSDSA